MQSTVTLVRRRGCAPKTFNPAICVTLIGLTGFAMAASPASALVSGAGSSLQQQLKQDSAVVEVRARGAGRAAIGFVAAASAAAWAGAQPAPGYCWYYTDPSRTQGFWDVCP
jgi:hypothetical protein